MHRNSSLHCSCSLEYLAFPGSRATQASAVTQEITEERRRSFAFQYSCYLFPDFTEFGLSICFLDFTEFGLSICFLISLNLVSVQFTVTGKDRAEKRSGALSFLMHL